MLDKKITEPSLTPVLAPCAESSLVLARHAEGIAWVTLNRHAKRNAITVEMADAFCMALDSIESNDIRVGILQSEGSMFCAGADLNEIALGRGASAVETMITRLRRSNLLWIAKVQGGALGAGVALALSCPLVVVSEDAWFSLPELSSVGRVPLGVVDMLSPILGVRAALGMALAEERIAANEAYGLGWTTRPVSPCNLQQRVDEIARKCAAVEDGSTVEISEHWRQYLASQVARRNIK